MDILSALVNNSDHNYLLINNASVDPHKETHGHGKGSGIPGPLPGTKRSIGDKVIHEGKEHTVTKPGGSRNGFKMEIQDEKGNKKLVHRHEVSDKPKLLSPPKEDKVEPKPSIPISIPQAKLDIPKAIVPIKSAPSSRVSKQDTQQPNETKQSFISRIFSSLGGIGKSVIDKLGSATQLFSRQQKSNDPIQTVKNQLLGEGIKSREWEGDDRKTEAYKEKVAQAAQKAGLFIPRDKLPESILKGKNIGGTEHNVYLDKNNDRVYKMSKGNRFGQTEFGKDVDIHDYLNRITILNKMWPELGIKFHGITRDQTGTPQTLISMSHIKGSHPEERELQDYLRGNGWKRVSERGDNWVNRRNGIKIGDVNHENFIKTSSGKIVPIDVYAERTSWW